MRERTSKTDFARLNPCVFLLSLPVTAAVTLGTVAMNHGTAKDFLTFCFWGFLFDAVCFYRLNNGIIAFLRGRFGVPLRKSRKRNNTLSPEEKAALLSKAGHGTASLLGYKTGTGNLFQLFKQKDAFFLKFCPDSSAVLDAKARTYAPPKKAKDTVIAFSSLQDITRKGDAEALTLCFCEKKKRHYFTLLSPVSEEALRAFLCTDNQSFSLLVRNAPKKAKRENPEKALFLSRLLTGAVSILSMQTLVIRILDLQENVPWNALCAFLLAAVLLSMVILPFRRPDLFRTDESGSDKKPNLHLAPLLAGCVIFLIELQSTAILSAGLSFLIIAGATAALCILLLPQTPRRKGKKWTDTAYQLLVFVTVCSAVVLLVNHSIALQKSAPQSYSVTDLSVHTNRGVTHYNADVETDGKTVSLSISEDEYFRHISRINASRATGLLGIRYLEREP